VLGETRKEDSVNLGRIVHDRRLRRVKAAGLQIADDCRLTGWPEWGSEPYLISVGRRVTIAGGVAFLTHDGGTWVFRDRPGYEGVVRYGRITIHDGCFIGYGAILLPGIEIGPNSVVAAGAVVSRSVPPDSVAAGVPATVIMSVDEYARRCRDESPELDRAAYRHDKPGELLRLYPRPW
jgi:carbonic anhydrase/acetyltransferase-like protein (isoleucine patch superfamily)